MHTTARRGLPLVVAMLAAFALIPVFAAPAGAAGRPPVLERFIARFNPQRTTTFYIATAGDPDGGKVSYRWSLRAACGFLTDPKATGSSNGYQFGPPAKRPDGCSSEDEQSARVTLRIVDTEGCVTIYTQAARNETEHVKPKTRSEPCPPPADGKASGGISPVLVLLPVAAAVGVLALLRARPRRREAPVEPALWGESRPAEEPGLGPVAGSVAGSVAGPGRSSRRGRTLPNPQTRFADQSPPEGPAPEGEIAPSPVQTPEHQPLPTRRALSEDGEEAFRMPATTVEVGHSVRGDNTAASSPDPTGLSDDDAAAALSPVHEQCEEGAVRGEGNDLVAHDTVLAGAVLAGVIGGSHRVEVPPGAAREIMRLADGLASQPTLEIEVEIPLRLVTVVSSRREVCRGGRWVPDIQSATHDGPQRIERLRVLIAAPEDLERFAQQILTRRLQSLVDARRRLESALASMRS